MTIRHRIVRPQQETSARSARQVFGVLAVIGALTLAGCAPVENTGGSTPPGPETSQSATVHTAVASTEPTPVQKPPISADEAIEGSAVAVEQYIEKWVSIRNDTSVDPQTINIVAYDQGAQTVIDEAKTYRDAGITVTGGLTYEPDGNQLASSATVDGTEMEFGAVQISGCLDVTEIAGTYADGTAAATSTDKRYLWEFRVTYLSSAGRWMISQSDLPEVRASC